MISTQPLGPWVQRQRAQAALGAPVDITVQQRHGERHLLGCSRQSTRTVTLPHCRSPSSEPAPWAGLGCKGGRGGGKGTPLAPLPPFWGHCYLPPAGKRLEQVFLLAARAWALLTHGGEGDLHPKRTPVGKAQINKLSVLGAVTLVHL